MAVTSVKEIWSGRRGSQDIESKRDYARVFRVGTNDVKDGPLTVRLAPGLPRIKDVYLDANGAVDAGSFCNSVDAAHDQDDPNTWQVTAEYSSDVKRLDIPENPLNKPVEVTWATAKQQRPTDEDIHGNAIVNSAGEKFDPVVEKDDSRIMITFKRNEPFFPQQIAFIFQDVVNEDVWFGAPVLTCKVESIAANLAFENGIFFWPVTYTIEFRRDGWQARLLDQGYYEKGDSQAEPKKLILDKNGQPLTAPALLDGKGKKLKEGEKPVFLSFFLYDIKPFAQLNLPDPRQIPPR